MTLGFLKTEPNKLCMCCSACKVLGAIQGTPQVGDGPFSQRASGADGENSYKRKTLEQSALNGVSLGLKNRGEEPQVGCLCLGTLGGSNRTTAEPWRTDG